MKCGICICGLNGSGKTTLAGTLAKELNFKHMDIEQYYSLLRIIHIRHQEQEKK